MSRRDEEQEVRGLEEVARAYEAAQFDEAPPEHVDRTVRASAARHARRRLRGIPLRPAYVAWAAVIVLSVSIVVELGMPPAPPEIGGAQKATDLDGAGSAESAVELDRTRSTAPQPAVAPVRERTRAAAERQEARAASSVERREAAPAAPRSADDTAAPRASVLADRALQRFEPGPAAPPAEDGGGVDAAGAGRSPPACPASARAAPDTWLACLLQLRREQNGAAADDELSAFTRRYPNYPLPRELVPAER